MAIMITISSLSLPVALKLNSQSFSGLEDFFECASIGEYRMFTHRNYYYSTPKWGEKWPSGKDYQFHKVEVKCGICGHMPGRNVSAVGTLYLVKNYKNKSGRAMIVCEDHLKGMQRYICNRDRKYKRLSMF